MAKKKVTYVISELTDRSVPFEWVAESAIGRDFDLSFVVMNQTRHSSLEKHLQATGSPVHFIQYNGKKQLPSALLSLARFFVKTRPDVIHTHLTGANLAGLASAALTRVPKRIYTRHHTTLNHDYYRHAVAYDQGANLMATDIIATCKNGRNVLIEREGVRDSKIHVINNGFKLDLFGDIPEGRVDALRRKHDLSGKNPVIGVISKYIEWKGIQYAIPAFKEILKSHPEAVLVLANARPSPYRAVIHDLLKDIPKERYREIVFEEDAPALYRLFDVFVHLPIDPEVEAFGQVYIEALASGIPSVVTLSGIAREFIEHGKNAWVIPFRDSQATAESVLKLLSHPDMARDIARQGQQDVRRRYGFDIMVRQLAELYAT